MRRPKTYYKGKPVCPGSGRPGYDGRYPGDSDRCAYCSRDHVRVLESGVLARHAQGNGRRRGTVA
jgi:hypothetical protein